MSKSILILGAGLTGLTLAWKLRNSGWSVQLLEARDRIGGRIDTRYEQDGAGVEMGATWLGKKHTALNKLLEQLEIDIFPQQMGKTAIYEALSTSPPQLVTLPPNPDPSYRIRGGSTLLVRKLADALLPEQIKLEQVVQHIRAENGQVIVQTDKARFTAEVVVSTLPPYLLLNTIRFDTPLPEPLSQIAEATHTWMGESIKVGLTYKQPFWRNPKLSGTIFSNVGPIPEMYDHSNFEDNFYALKGFFNGSYFSIDRKARRDMVLTQLEKYYGKQVYNYINYQETVWRTEPYTFHVYKEHLLPHQNNGHPVFQKSIWKGKFWLAGAETASAHPGYMEGAVRSAAYVSEQLLKMDYEKIG